MSLITITQSKGGAGEKIAKLVADSLSLELYDDARPQHTVQTMGQEFEDLKHFDEKAPGFFDRLLSNKPDIFQDLMEAVIYEVAKKRRGGHHRPWRTVFAAGLRLCASRAGLCHPFLAGPTGSRVISNQQPLQLHLKFDKVTLFILVKLDIDIRYGQWLTGVKIFI